MLKKLLMEPTKKPSSQTALLLQIVQDMAEIKADIKAVADHETRIRELEKARWSSAWLTGLLSSGISAILYIVIANQLGK
jgi:cell division protein FtsX